MDGNGRVHPDCANAANPYHECAVYCLEKIAEGKSAKEKEKEKEKKKLGSKILDASRSFGRKKKGSESQSQSKSWRGSESESQSKSWRGSESQSQSMSSRALEITPAIGAVYLGDPRSPRSHFSRKKMEAENGDSVSSSEQHSEEIYSRNQSLDKTQIQYTGPLPMSGKITSPRDTPAKFKEAEKVQNSPKASSDVNSEDGREDATNLNFSFLGLGIVQVPEGSDEEEEVKSVISDSCVSVGKYHVKASISSILRSIIDKYGDIAANCHLESASMRAYYLECLCAVVQELQSTSFKQLTKAKVKEMFAVLKDVESAGIDVSWLRALLNEISEAVEIVSQLQTFEAKKAEFNHSLESIRKELESQMEDLAQKEKEAADAREQVAGTKARLDDIEYECSKLDKTMSSMATIMEKFQGKSLADQLL